MLLCCTAGAGATEAGLSRPGRRPPRGLLFTGTAFWAAGAEDRGDRTPGNKPLIPRDAPKPGTET